MTTRAPAVLKTNSIPRKTIFILRKLTLFHGQQVLLLMQLTLFQGQQVLLSTWFHHLFTDLKWWSLIFRQPNILHQHIDLELLITTLIIFYYL